MPIGEIAEWDPPGGAGPLLGEAILVIPGWDSVCVFDHDLADPALHPWGIWILKSQWTGTGG